jgi:hypothetical protein
VDPEQGRKFWSTRHEAYGRLGVTIDANRPARCYNWAFHPSSQLVHFMNQRR